MLLEIDAFNRLHWLYPLQRKFPRHMAEHLFKIFSEHEPPDRLQSDNGGDFQKKMYAVMRIFLNIFDPHFNEH